MDNMALAENIRKSREIAGLTVAEVAAQSGISPRRLSRIEKGTADVYVSELLALCDTIKVSLTSLVNKASKRIRAKVTQESIEGFISIKETAELLGISEEALRGLCFAEEIPHIKVKKAFLFRWTELDKWLDMQFNNRLPGKERRYAIRGTRSGIEPLLSEREIKEIFGGSIPTRREQGEFVPVYYIGRRKRYRLSDILAFLERSRVDVYSVPRFSRGWETISFDREPSQEELDAKRLERKFASSNGDKLVPGYEWASLSFHSDSPEDVEKRLVDFQEALENKWQLANTRITWNARSFSVSVKYMRIPPAWAGHKVMRTTKRADFQNLLRMRVEEFIAKNVPKDRLIEVRNFTDRFFFRPYERHCATIFYYEADDGKPSEPGVFLNRKAHDEYEKLREEATIRVPKRIWQAIEDLREGKLEPRKFTYLLREAELFDRMDEAGLLVYKRRDEVLDVKKSSDWSEHADGHRDYSYSYRWPASKFARIVKMGATDDKAYEEKREHIRRQAREAMQEMAFANNEARRAAVERCDRNYQTRLEAFYGEDKASSIRGNLTEEDWSRLVWLQKYWDQAFIEDGRRRNRPKYFVEWEEYVIPVLDYTKIAEAWKVRGYDVREVVTRLIEAGAVFNNAYRGIVAINPFLDTYLQEATGESTKPRSWGMEKHRNFYLDTLMRPDAEMLAELIKRYSNLTIGKIFGVSDVAVKKWMKGFGLERDRRIINSELGEEEILSIRKDIEERLR